MTITYRKPTDDEWPNFGQAVARGFGNHPPLDAESVRRWDYFGKVIHAVGAWDGETVVGTSGAFTSETTVPGGARLSTALVTIVTVAATHRRRGLLTNMMRRVLAEAHERGEPIATLWASESIIYGRFGYGMAGQHHVARIRSDKARLVHLPEINGTVRYADRARIREVGPEIWSRTAARQPGMPGRDEDHWRATVPLPVDESKPENLRFHAIYEEAGKPHGFVTYKTTDKGDWTGLKDVVVEELIAATDAAHAALWQFVLGVDLVDNVSTEMMRLDDPLWWMLEDPRQLRRTPYDAIWLRLLDVEKALAARTYSGPIDLVLEVQDEFCPWVDGRYRLAADESGLASCERTDRPADIRLPAASLATCYFGSTRFSDLARAGRATGLTDGALEQADSAFRSEREPWCPLHY